MAGSAKPINHPKNFVDITGSTFHYLTVIAYSHTGKFDRPYWRCRCICGKEVVLVGLILKRGEIKSCGCMRKGINLGSKNGQWKGKNVGYGALHDWVQYHLPKPQACQMCGEARRLDLANISGEYRRELSDWEWLCRRCHMKSDGRINNLRQYQASKQVTHQSSDG